MDQDIRDAAVAATEAAEPKTEAERLQKLFADQGIELSVEQVQAILQGNRADDKLAATSGDLADANALRDSGVRGKGTWIPGYKGGVYVGRGIGGGLADMLRAGLGAYRGKQARDKMDEIIEAKGQGVDAGTYAKILAQMGPRQQQAPMAAALRQAPAQPQAAPNYAYTGGSQVGTPPNFGKQVTATPAAPFISGQAGPGGAQYDDALAAILRSSQPVPPIPTPNGAGGRIQSSYLSSLLRGGW